MKLSVKAIIMIAAFILVLIVIALFTACEPADVNYGDTDNSEKYGAAVEFEGEPHEASVFFVNVGKADCAIVSVDGHTWLIDTGTESSFSQVYAALGLLGADELDGVILTHEHDDHAGGLDPIAQRFGIGMVITPECLNSRGEIDSVIYDNELAAETRKAGESIEITEDVSFSVLAPEKLTGGDDNNNSLVVKLTVNGRSFLFTGDMEKAEEELLLASGADISCDVLKVPNHGNNDATGEAFADKASPLIAVISTDTSVDGNSANRRVMARLGMAEVYVTQKYELGVLLTVSPRGEIALSFPERPEKSGASLEITEASKAQQTFTVKNNGSESVDLSGWFVYSSKGYEVFNFPEGTEIAAGGELLVTFTWNRRSVAFARVQI